MLGGLKGSKEWKIGRELMRDKRELTFNILLDHRSVPSTLFMNIDMLPTSPSK